jgi:Tetracyclin repressor-like, C-terminal domain
VHLPAAFHERLTTVADTADPDRLGEAILRAITDLWSDPDALDAWLGMLRSAIADEQVATMLREFLASAILSPVAERLGTPDAPARMVLAASQIVGLAVARYVLRLEPLASASADELVAAVAPNVQRYLTGDVALPADLPGRASLRSG